MLLARRSFLLFIASTVTIPAAAARAQKVWNTYRNERFGTSIEYPADRFRSLPPPENGDGLQFEANDGAQFTVSAIRNVLEDSFAEIQDSYLKERDPTEEITYRTKGANWFVLSGTRGDLIFYERHLVSHRNEIINTFDIKYPATLKRIYDPITARMSGSLRAGIGIGTGRP
jgi:hypothetical protein